MNKDDVVREFRSEKEEANDRIDILIEAPNGSIADTISHKAKFSDMTESESIGVFLGLAIGTPLGLLAGAGLMTVVCSTVKLGSKIIKTIIK